MIAPARAAGFQPDSPRISGSRVENATPDITALEQGFTKGEYDSLTGFYRTVDGQYLLWLTCPTD